MPFLITKMYTDELKRLCFAVVLAFACALPVVAQDNADKPTVEEELAAAIVMPDNPTREQSQAYVAQVVQLGEQLRKRGLDYTQCLEFMASARKFDAVPDRDIDLLISNMGDWNVHTEISASILRRDRKVIKPIVVAGLDEHPKNILAIRFFGWYEDAREPIMRKFNELETLYAVPYDNAWLHAFTHLAEPKHYPKIKQLFMSSSRRSEQALMLETMPGYDILDTIRACIAETEKAIAERENKREYLSQHHREVERLYVIAARAGDVQSLGKLIDVLNDPQQYDPFFYYSNNEMDIHRDNVTQFIDFKGSNKEIAEWYKTNREKLVFDNFKKRFVIEEEF
jgi:hypothetical protein